MTNENFAVAVRTSEGIVYHHVDGTVFKKKNLAFGATQHLSLEEKAQDYNIVDLLTGMTVGESVPRKKDLSSWQPDEELIKRVERMHKKYPKQNMMIIDEMLGTSYIASQPSAVEQLKALGVEIPDKAEKSDVVNKPEAEVVENS